MTTGNGTGHDLGGLIDGMARRVPAPPEEHGRQAMRRGRLLRRRATVRRTAVPTVGILLVVALAGLLISTLGSLHREPGSTTGCRSGSTPAFGRLGAIAYVNDGSLHLLDVDTRRDRVLVPHGASLPVRWSPDGAWIAFRLDGSTVAVVPSSGGRVCEPLGAGVSGWSWSPTSSFLVGVTANGGVRSGDPELAAKRLLPDGWGALGVPAFNPTGRAVAIASGGGSSGSAAAGRAGVWTLDVESGRAIQLVRAANGEQTAPMIAGWSLDGRSIFFWPGAAHSTPATPTQTSIDVVRASGGEPTEVVARMSAAADFLSWCDREVVLVGGAEGSAPGGQLLDAAYPTWLTAQLSLRIPSAADARWPACALHKKLVAASLAQGSGGVAPASRSRVIWLLQPRGFTGPVTTPGPGFSDEAPRWSPDGRFLLFVRRSLISGEGMIYVLPVGEDGSPDGSLIGPLATLGSDPSSTWTERLSWYGAQA